MKEVKYIVVFLALISLFSLVSADCSDNQIIMRLGAQNNSHASLWDYNFQTPSCGGIPVACNMRNSANCNEVMPPLPQNPQGCYLNTNNLCVGTPKACSVFNSNIDGCNSAQCNWNSGSLGYDYKVCYSDIFGSDYSGENSHDCDNNRIIGLYSENNSHASSNEDYSIDVCYGDLVCDVKASRSECDSWDGRVVVSLYSINNSHVSVGDDVNYPLKICCKSASGLSDAYWADMRGEPISEANLGDKVKLVAPGLENKEIDFTIYKSNLFWFDKKVGSFVTWRTNESGDFYFKAVPSDGSSEEVQSDILTVSENEDNNPPFVNITGLVDKQIYFQGETLNFGSIIEDVDDGFNFSWDLGDGVVKTGNSSSSINYDFTHSYSGVGQKVISLTATDERGAVTRDAVSILIVNASSSLIYFDLAYIDSPIWADVYGPNVLFNASSSYAVNTSLVGSDVFVNCLAGNCPSRTEGCNPPAVNYPDCRINLTNSPNAAGFDKLNFSWLFDGNYFRSGMGSAGANSGAIFNQVFILPRVHTANLSVFFGDGTLEYGGLNSVMFSTSSGLYRCVNGNKWVYENSAGASEVDSLQDCYRAGGVDNSTGQLRENCCPNGWNCGGSNKCVPNITPTIRCADYSDSDSCNDDGFNVGNLSVNEWAARNGYGNNFCSANTPIVPPATPGCTDYPTNCRCYWDSGSRQCNYKFTPKEQCLGGPIPGGNCTLKTINTVDDCVNSGFMIYSVEATWVGDATDPLKASCKSNEVRGLCSKSIVKLPFFSWINVIAVAFILVLFYSRILIRKKF